jgi:hypothetical protein
MVMVMVKIVTTIVAMGGVWCHPSLSSLPLSWWGLWVMLVVVVVLAAAAVAVMVFLVAVVVVVVEWLSSSLCIVAVQVEETRP